MLVVTSFLCCANAFNITEILAKHPKYSKFNRYLSLTRLADDINSRKTITVLAVRNGALHELKALDLGTIKRALSLHVLLSFYDAKMLRHLNNHTTLTTTLYQTTGLAPGNAGSINITSKDKKVAFGLAAKGSKLDVKYVRQVYKDSFNLSVIEVSQVITTDVAAAAPVEAPNEVNITAVLVKAGCGIFSNLLDATGVIRAYEDAVYSGLTVFAPTDPAFKGLQSQLDKLSTDNKESLLKYHALPTYSPHSTFKFSKSPIATLASNARGKYDLRASSAGDVVTLNTGVNKATITSTLLDDAPLVILTVNGVLKPKELFSVAPAPAPVALSPPAPAPESPENTPFQSAPPDATDSSNVSKTSIASAATLLLFLIGCVGVLML